MPSVVKIPKEGQLKNILKRKHSTKTPETLTTEKRNAVDGGVWPDLSTLQKKSCGCVSEKVIFDNWQRVREVFVYKCKRCTTRDRGELFHKEEFIEGDIVMDKNLIFLARVALPCQCGEDEEDERTMKRCCICKRPVCSKCSQTNTCKVKYPSGKRSFSVTHCTEHQERCAEVFGKRIC